MNVYNHIAEKSHVENEMSKMNLPRSEEHTSELQSQR